MSVEITSPRQKVSLPIYVSNDEKHFVTPGEVITEDTGFMKGHGTYADNADRLAASVAGIVERVNKLISVKPFKTRYNGEVGDVVVGRISEVGQKRWRVDTYARLDSVLLLSAVNLPGGELRRRSTKDELLMRDYLVEGDLIVAEVQSLFADGSLSLHSRNLKYGKLPEGVLVKVSPSLVRRCKTHMHNLPFGATVILGNNGYIWIGPLMSAESDLSSRNTSRKSVGISDRHVIARLKNCITCLALFGVQLYDTSVTYAYDASLKYEVKELLRPEVQEEVVDVTRNNLAQHI
ncbi:exosome complex component RRP4-like [Hydractinia symbiolongicarpus]|uniref:exosome complex component RRP4-like n=1 Tax=Hydractinia symbiolongicarpus TaxID=13093 RepID=UPI00254AFF55|nr:exosome complex component RRP4-like [Hydractinia symbiolongicarpus]